MTRASGPLLFNPARASFDELEQTFVARRALLDQLEADLLADAKGKTARHWQLIAPRGAGKSHFTALLGHRLRCRGWAVVPLPEEHYQVASVGELLEQIVIRLDQLEASPFREISSPRDVEEKALDYLRGWKKRHAEPILVILENLGLLFERQLTSTREQSRLREILMRDAPFVLLTTSTSYLESTARHASPFYDFFHTHTLDELSRSEIIELVKARARWDKEEALLRDFDSVRARLDALYHLGGGSPRLALALYSIVRQGIRSELPHQLMRLLDEVTPSYQARLRDLAPQMERVVIEMALAEGPLTPSALARRCRMATNQVTANIAKLVATRLVRPGARPDGRRRYYQISDRFFRIWLQMREDVTAGERLKLLVEFFRCWYGEALEALEEDVLARDPSHDGAHEARAIALVKELARRDGPLDADSTHDLLTLLARMVSVDAGAYRELVAWLVANAPPQLLRACFIEGMPGIIRGTGGGAALALYRELRDRGVLPPDLPPYADAEALEASPEPMRELDALHPELREAVSLVLPHAAGGEAAVEAGSRASRDPGEPRGPADPDTRPRRAPEARARSAGVPSNAPVGKSRSRARGVAGRKSPMA